MPGTSSPAQLFDQFVITAACREDILRARARLGGDLENGSTVIIQSSDQARREHKVAARFR